MRQHLLQIDVSKSKQANKKDLIQIKFKNSDALQLNFPKLFIQSQYIQDKYKYPEALNMIQDEFDDIENKMNISEESIKSFIQLIDEDQVKIPIERYRDIYTLSEYFCLQDITSTLDNLSNEFLLNDLDFTIQILADSDREKNGFDTKLQSKIENFLKERINESIENAKFRELTLPTICRIVEQSRQIIDHNLLVDFILDSAETRFILFKFVELHRLSEDKIDEMIEFFDTQEETTKKTYFEYLPFNLSFIKNMKNKYDELLKEFNTTKRLFDEEKVNHSRTKEELKESLRELKRTKVELDRSESEMKRYTQSVIVCGFNDFNQLGEKSNNEDKNGHPCIHPPLLLSFDHSSHLSYSSYGLHSVLVMSDGSLKGIGYNKGGEISSTLQKTVIDHFTDFCIKDGSGRQLTAISAVCSWYGTLYMFSKSSGNERQLVLCDREINGGDPVFLDIGNHHPVSLFGGRSHSAAICSEGEVIFINRDSIKNSPNSPIASVSLPDGEKASSVACCDDSLIVLSSNGRVFTSTIESNGVLNFSIVSELSNQEIVCVSGAYKHFLAVSKEGRVFGRGSNINGQLGLGEETKSVSSFTQIPSLIGYEIRAAYAGYKHSLFETREGKILSCGSNDCGQLLLNNGPGENVYSPIETTITGGSTFCIAGNGISLVFTGRVPSANTPNMLIK